MRLLTLEEMMASWGRQSERVKLFLSVSVDAIMVDATTAALERLRAEHGDWLHTRMFTAKRSQFEHYLALAMQAKEMLGSKVWVMFSDDDDVWHPERTAKYWECARALDSGGDAMKGANGEPVLAMRDGRAVAGDLPPGIPGTAEAVDAALEAGTAMKMLTGPNDEYWIYACRLPTLLDFVMRASPRLLRCPFCDMYLVKYFKRTGYAVMEQAPETGVGWSYAYRGVPGMRRSVAATSLTDVNLLELVYSGMPPGRQGRDVMMPAAMMMWRRFKLVEADAIMTEEDMRAAREECEAVLDVWELEVQSGRMDVFACSPMPPPPDMS